MIVKCISNSGKDLSDLSGFPKNYISDNLRINSNYEVYAIGRFDSYLHYLLNTSDIDNEVIIAPNWYPNEWFEVVDSKIPSNWHFGYLDNESKNTNEFIIGYKELALNYEHHCNLLEREILDLTIFLEMKSK